MNILETSLQSSLRALQEERDQHNAEAWEIIADAELCQVHVSQSPHYSQYLLALAMRNACNLRIRQILRAHPELEGVVKNG